MARTRGAPKLAPRRQDVFFAFPSRPPALNETINNGIHILERNSELRQAGVRFRPWPDVAVSGTRLLSSITEAINRSVLVACDITYPNANVAFELGYAVGRAKRVWVSLDKSIQGATTTFKQLYTGMLGVGYAPYENYESLADAFMSDRPWQTLDKHLLGDDFLSRVVRTEQPSLLYLKPPHATSAVIRAQEVLSQSAFRDGLITDDPQETPGTTLEWFAEKARDCDGVVVHLLADNQDGSAAHNAKGSFVAGLAHGLRKPILMLAHEPFQCPTDYTTLLKAHETAAQCESQLREWLESVPIVRRARRAIGSPPAANRRLELRNLSIGEPFAENEQSHLDEYFVETSDYFTPLEAQTTVLVGRRGTGKTATLIALQAAFRADPRNHVCVIKPVGYEVDGLIRLLNEEWRQAERGFLVESLWKFLIYSELSGSLVREIRGRPIHYQMNEDERLLSEHVEANADVLLAPFSQRLNRAVGALQGTGSIADTEVQRDRISEHLHMSQIGALHERLTGVLAGRGKVAILVDNLDEPWHPGSDTVILSGLLLGLLRVTHNMVEGFDHPNPRRRVDVSLTTFIRSDIFAYIEPLANERDKWPLRRINWNDRELLLRVVDNRLGRGGIVALDTNEVWEKLFAHEVAGLPVRDFILNNILARPRDVIFFVKEAVSHAVNRGHERVEAEDLLSARESYSRYVFGSVQSEDDPRRNQMAAVLYEFAGCTRSMSEAEMQERIAKAGVVATDVDFYVNLLCDVNFTGIRTSVGYRYPDDENDREMLLQVARRLIGTATWPGEDMFCVNPAFHHALQID